MSRISKFIETESRSEGEGSGEEKGTANGHGVSLWGDENFGIESGDGCTTL